ncbi:universal stress protein [Halocynthiibacter styelae]|uniref:Universal stress protein n=1 Tax=Halocynthiibacter styelae TaxID=2761955 RepID=A0A8J7IL36_9RHOB|nr:universal stress protein [Paenihalocynthiibacter styelae]MBI1495293.1 universal stress protein [Paenihalocynthiibacter styelae]
MSKIIALVDGSAYSESTCDYAAWIAAREGHSVEVLHIITRKLDADSNLSGNIGLGARSKLMDQLADLDAQQAKLANERGRAILEDAETRIKAAGVTDVTTRLRHGDLLEELLEAEKSASLVVVGKRGENADFASGHLGSNLERVVRTSAIPVLVASRAFTEPKSFLLAFDGGKTAMKAVNHLAQAKTFAGLEARVISAGIDGSKHAIEGAAATLKAAGFDVSHEITEGTATEVIAARIHVAGQDDNPDGADMLVMGAYGHSRIRRLIIGSTTTEMIRTCQVPLLLVR